MNKEQLNYEKKFRQMLGCIKEVPIDMVNNWLGGFEIKVHLTLVEAVASALAYGDISFGMEVFASGVPEYNNTLYDVKSLAELSSTDYSRVKQIKKYLTSPTMIAGCCFIIESDSLLKWLEKNYPLEDPSSAPTNSMPFMSDKLRFAVDVSAVLYPNGYQATSKPYKTQLDFESKRIKDKLEKHTLTTREREALVVQLNPVKK